MTHADQSTLEVFMVEHWTATGRVTTVGPSEPLDPYVNRQPFRLGQGTFSDFLARARKGVFSLVPLWVLQRVQAPAEHAFRSLHSSAEMAKVRQALGWQHSPESRGDGADRPKGNQWTWAGWLDEVVNLFMGLRHVEVIFPLHPREQAIKCFDVVFAHQHLAWWRSPLVEFSFQCGSQRNPGASGLSSCVRLESSTLCSVPPTCTRNEFVTARLNIRTMPSDEFFVSSTHSPASNRTTFLRVDFVAPGGLLEIDSGEASLTEQLHRHCPGWRKHWGRRLCEKNMLDFSRPPSQKDVPFFSPLCLLPPCFSLSYQTQKIITGLTAKQVSTGSKKYSVKECLDEFELPQCVL